MEDHEKQVNEENLGMRIKRQILTQVIKNPCCKSSFICGTEVFAKSRRNKLTDEIARYKEKLNSKKRRSFFDEQEDIGYVAAEQDLMMYPKSSGRVCNYCHSCMVRGAFLVCGRASESDDGLHIEMSMPNEKAASVMEEILKATGINVKCSKRRNETILYLKKRDSVSDFIAYLGAVSVVFDIINESILKERRAVANRQKNCDTTNIMKSVSASERQLAAINALKEHGILDELPITLRQTAYLRLENPIEPLDVITELHGGKISRSGVNHRLAKIIEIAEKNGFLIK